MMMGKSPQESWSATCAVHRAMSSKARASSANITAPAPADTSMRASSAVEQLTQAMPLLARRLHMSTPSRPDGAATTTRTSYSHHKDLETNLLAFVLGP